MLLKMYDADFVNALKSLRYMHAIQQHAFIVKLNVIL